VIHLIARPEGAAPSARPVHPTRIAMFALPADLSVRFAHQRMADDRDKAARHQRARAARHGAASPGPLDAPALRHRPDRAPAGHLTVRTAEPARRDAFVTSLTSMSPRTAYRRFFADVPGRRHSSWTGCSGSTPDTGRSHQLAAAPAQAESRRR
jgi:hypothetical protein